MARLAIVTLLVLGCGPTNSKPTGSTADPVETCTRFGDVCKLDKSRLGVCEQPRTGSGFACQSQH